MCFILGIVPIDRTNRSLFLSFFLSLPSYDSFNITCESNHCTENKTYLDLLHTHNTGVLLFVNRNNLGFEDIDDVDPTTALELTTEDLKVNADNLLLQYVKFQRVKSITLFVEDNNGGEITSLGGLKFFGKPIGTTNMADFKKQG